MEYEEWINRRDQSKYSDLYHKGENDAWEMNQDRTDLYGQDYAEGYKTGAKDCAIHTAYHAAREAKDADVERRIDQLLFQRAEAWKVCEANKVTTRNRSDLL